MTEYEKMVQLLELSWSMRSQIVPCLVGPPGIGKTAAVMEHASHHGSNVIKIVASRCVPSETVGMTMPDHKQRSMTIYNSMQLSSLRDGDILFLDELLEADQFVLSTLLTVIESREMADGTPLPDIQIIAATNDTIPPEQLKGNIRQRFMFQRFKVDSTQTKDYIKKMTGLDLSSLDTTNALVSGGNDYNFLTPRSLTKLCLWVDSIDKDKLDDWAALVNAMWASSIGSLIAQARLDRDARLDSPETQVRRFVKDIVPEDVACDHDDFENCSMSEMLEILQGLPEWDQIADRLSQLEVKEPETSKVKMDF